jgi:hypothetical protein
LRPGAYELLLRFDDGHEELRLTDHLELFTRSHQTLELRGQRWQVVDTEPPSRDEFIARLVCAPEQTEQRRRTKSALVGNKTAYAAHY